MSERTILEMRDISKTFGGIRALKGVSIDMREGEVHSLMGENGAGKSTLMKILSGAYTPDAGSQILVDGKPVTMSSPMDAKALGVAIIYQELALSPNLTVAENIYLGREPKRAGMVDRAAMERGCADVLKRLGATYGPGDIVGGLTLAERQLVEIARAVHAKSRILVMDEPTTMLSERETERLFVLVRQLKAEGLAIVYISHRMNEVYELSDRVSVLRDGAYVGTLEGADIKPDALVKMMVGRDLSSFYKKEHDAKAARGDVIFKVAGMSDGRRVRGCSLALHRGEVLGVAGLVGAGRTEFARLVYGADARVAGSIELDGAPVQILSPGDAMQAGVLYLTEDRKQLGLFLDMSISENINVGVVDRDCRTGGILDFAKAKKRAAEAVKALAVRTVSPKANVGALSGGNQQKVLLARLLELKPRVLILDEPTRGVDIGAKSEIYRLIDDLAKAGVGIIVISSELPEIIGVCDRVIVMREGAFVGEVGGPGGGAVTQEAIVALATSAPTAQAA